MFPAYARSAMTAAITRMHGKRANFSAILKIDVYVSAKGVLDMINIGRADGGFNANPRPALSPS
jgi:hypothetical protein